MSTKRLTVFVMEGWSRAALAVIESLARGGLRVAVGSDKRLSAGFHSHYCRERHLYPSPRHCSGEFKQWLLEFLSHRHIEMLFPVGHYGARAVSEIQDEIRRHTLLSMPDPATFQTAYAKISTINMTAL